MCRRIVSAISSCRLSRGFVRLSHCDRLPADCTARSKRSVTSNDHHPGLTAPASLHNKQSTAASRSFIFTGTTRIFLGSHRSIIVARDRQRRWTRPRPTVACSSRRTLRERVGRRRVIRCNILPCMRQWKYVAHLFVCGTRKQLSDDDEMERAANHLAQHGRTAHRGKVNAKTLNNLESSAQDAIATKIADIKQTFICTNIYPTVVAEQPS